ADISHEHSAGDIASGTLPIARGGTGQTTEAGMRGVYTGSNAKNLSFPIGTVLMAVKPSGGGVPLVGQSSPVYAYTSSTGSNYFSMESGTGFSAVSGTWRSRGQFSAGTVNDLF